MSLLPVVALAQATTPQIDVESLMLDPAARGSLITGSGETLRGGHFRIGLAAGYTYGQLSFDTANTEGAIVLRDRITGQLFGAVGITDWLEIGASLPVVIQQFAADTPPPFPISAAGLGTPYLHVKFGILGEGRPIFLSLGLSAGLPLGTQGALSNQGFQVAPKLNLGHRFSGFTLSGEVSALIRSVGTDLRAFGGSYWDYMGNQLFASLAATTAGETARGELSVRFIAPLQQGWVGVEGLLGLRVNLKFTELFLALGPGFGAHPNTPGFRVYLGAAFGNMNEKPKPKCVEGEPYELAECPELDRDHDKVKNGADKCPAEAEDLDGFQDGDGCPDKDNDGDKVLDPKDKCPNQAGVVENDGCPDVDTDEDGVIDRLDRCPADPEDLDGFQDDDGCPEVDNDGDGLTDRIDNCPNEKGIIEEKGCPARDDDGDTVPNHVDNCPQEKGDPANQGCPVKEKQLVVIETERLKLLQVVQFATGKATILPASNTLLTQVANVLKAQRRIKLVQVEGHTDNVGKPEKNLKLSQDRANAVKAFLVKKGIDESRLKAVGFGQERPLESNASAKGREANRRVELNIIEKDEPRSSGTITVPVEEEKEPKK
ncbi:MAG: OmpA family protein [Archangiaceae bacterium]|nr:OmpA family protein [Archangiaceae bacterium]